MVPTNRVRFKQAIIGCGILCLIVAVWLRHKQLQSIGDLGVCNHCGRLTSHRVYYGAKGTYVGTARFYCGGTCAEHAPPKLSISKSKATGTWSDWRAFPLHSRAWLEGPILLAVAVGAVAMLVNPPGLSWQRALWLPMAGLVFIGLLNIAPPQSWLPLFGALSCCLVGLTPLGATRTGIGPPFYIIGISLAMLACPLYLGLVLWLTYASYIPFLAAAAYCIVVGLLFLGTRHELLAARG